MTLPQRFETTKQLLPQESSTGRKREGRGRRILRVALGVFLVLGGVIGLVLPFLQGILMIMAGLALLRKDLPWVARLWERWAMPLWQKWKDLIGRKRSKRSAP